MKSADFAMYQAKADGGSCYRFYSAQMHMLAVGTGAIDGEVRRAAAVRI